VTPGVAVSDGRHPKLGERNLIGKQRYSFSWDAFAYSSVGVTGPRVGLVESVGECFVSTDEVPELTAELRRWAFCCELGSGTDSFRNRVGAGPGVVRTRRWSPECSPGDFEGSSAKKKIHDSKWKTDTKEKTSQNSHVLKQ